MFKIVKFIKDFLLFFPLTFIFLPFGRFFVFVAYFNKLIIWIYKNRATLLFCDFYSPVRDYAKRFKLYDFVAKLFALEIQPILYLEFGVASGASFKWWLEKNKNPASSFCGFDTFEGLPEDWGGFYKKGDMAARVPELTDQRAKFVKGLFQKTLNTFIDENIALLKSSSRKIIHLDADLYSATAFALSQLAQFLKKDDLILFDEFSVAMHEFKAYDEFTKNFAIRLKPIASVNNFYQTAFIVE